MSMELGKTHIDLRERVVRGDEGVDAVARQTEVQQELMRLGASNERLGMLIDTLGKRLNSVLRDVEPEGPTTADEVERQPAVPLARMIRRASDDARIHANWIEGIMARLEV